MAKRLRLGNTQPINVTNKKKLTAIQRSNSNVNQIDSFTRLKVCVEINYGRENKKSIGLAISGSLVKPKPKEIATVMSIFVIIRLKGQC